ncbi:exonuclease SbcCD subunit D [Clostridium gasigenes]|uniref:exonuclease SbcCD subunit D n=1 Tax=Clostridium gasigenes TaxID=94869 RepID=UPI0014386624|nr:exonuclease SbcCD subunit D [Clostridium gasigenes]MBU3103108.1 exonuclease SbcCD subunit D [Clostridium gasigenes]MBU3131701.1 exonuclease SbcCD subunit D [Clostridium gasigenes]MBU3135173.1 exonuclease SbcCD subunit D [Clostridium gasigenes]NKF05462.1 exonuclease SbcCD subunit D [Clostridium gasigenes]QSW18908.1 exonuclease SbcCD subunit D [Clostridium gasigenes]
MKIFHTADWHIGKLVNGFYMTEDQEFVIDQLFEKIKTEKPDVVLISGDLYDRSVPPVQAIELLNRIFDKIVRGLKTPIIALAGNHDSNERLNFGSDLLKGSGLYISGNLKRNIEKITLTDEYGPVNFYPIPYADPPIVRDLFDDNLIKTHNDAMNKIVNSIKQTLNTKERNIVMAHGYVTYSKNDKEELVILEESDSEKPLSIGGTDLINSSCFEGFNYTALGHLHGPQKVGSNKIRYSGSLLKYSFSEIKQKKGITIVNIDSNGEIEIELFEFKPRKDFRIITGELQQLLKENVVALENKEDYIKAILKDTGELLDPMAKLRSVYPNVMELVREDRLKASSNNKVVASNINEKSKFDLFQNFYEDIIGEECSLEEIEVIKKVITKAQKGCE